MINGIVLFMAIIVFVTNSCDDVKVISLNGFDEEVQVKSCNIRCWNYVTNGELRNQCREDCNQKDYEILAGYLGPAPTFYKICLQATDPEIQEALIKAWNDHVSVELDILEKKKAEEIIQKKQKQTELAYETYNEVVEFAKKHHIYF